MSITPQLSLVNPRTCHGLGMRTCSIAAVASYLPERVMTNAEVGRKIGEDGEWILPRTGIRERRIAAENEFTSDLAAQAARRALHKANLCAKDLDLILVATNTPDMLFPATACVVQAKIGARHCPAFDLKAGGAGFLYAMEIGGQFIASRTFETVLVVGAEKHGQRQLLAGGKNNCHQTLRRGTPRSAAQGGFEGSIPHAGAIFDGVVRE